VGVCGDVIVDGACFTSKTVIRMEDGGDGREASVPADGRQDEGYP